MVTETIKNFLRTRGQSYRHTFAGIHGEKVLDDLSRFCRANESTYHKDPRIEGVLQGRREVWLRIATHLNLTEDELWSHFNPTGEQ
jgi:predicted metal-dependent HD superfamily phosphohydrolase